MNSRPSTPAISTLPGLRLLRLKVLTHYTHQETLSFPQGQDNVTAKWLNQGNSELQAAGTRQVVWYFAEDYAAAYARSLFSEHGLGKIAVKVQHPW